MRLKNRSLFSIRKLEYTGQVEEAVKSHRKEMKRKREQGETSAGEGMKISNG